jgi:hypothetical protein
MNSNFSKGLSNTDLEQLNLKNDILRRRFDSLKYDIKKIEEGTTFRCYDACFSIIINCLAHYQLSTMFRFASLRPRPKPFQPKRRLRIMYIMYKEYK